ncbi:unnamed protein product [Moneuplotes crassus]|uniref:Uncharacterized protein n=1 Tax=Euplotes crassus TaxID=5936 RepID=A0AAD1UHU2_EUPCR|nr:unnamed protein product [Moneuplotes crassus]
MEPEESEKSEVMDSFQVEDINISRPLMHEHHTGQFAHSIQFWLSCLGSAVGYGNIWRFPSVLFNNGGGVFFIPYFICIFIIVFPLYYLECSYGQLFKKALHRYYDSINPKFLGVSAAVACVTLFLAMFYTTLLSWCISFLIQSFQDPLPWDTHSQENGVFWNSGYFKEDLLQASGGIGEYTHIVILVAVSFVIAGVANYIVIFNSLESVGYAVYVLIPLPYFLLSILFLKGITLEGFYTGWEFLFKPDWSKLWTFKIWKDAGAQVIFSLTIGVNVMMLFASNRDKNEKLLKAAIGVPILNFGTSIFASMTLFAFLGYASVKTEIPIEEMPMEGSELAFVVYPALITTLPFSQFWAIIFFIMLICLGLSSLCPYYEVCCCFLHGMLSRTKRFHKIDKKIVSLCFCFIVLVIDIILMASDAGFYWLTLFDHFSAGLNLLVLILIQTIILGWYLGLDYLEEKVHEKGETIPKIYKISIKYISPVFLCFLILFGIVDEIKNPLDMPPWAQFIGGSMLCFPILCIIASLVFR